MRIAFYAPMKPPDHPVPSGDRRMAQLLVGALRHAGHDVEVVSRLSSYLAAPDPARQLRLRAAASAEIERIAATTGRAPGFDLWFTYHNYHKAPDLLGPTLARRLRLPYSVAEASRSPKRAAAWGDWYRSAETAIAAADIHLCFTHRDRAGLEPLVGQATIVDLPPFIDVRGWPPAGLGTARQTPVIVTVAMMRAGDKLASYRLLARALGLLQNEPWQLVIVGDGPARPDVEAALEGLPPLRLTWTGALPAHEIPGVLAAGDLFAWPGFGEAFGLSYLEAQAMGLPVVALRVAGVASVVRDGHTGVLVDDAPTPDAYAGALRRLLRDGVARRRMAAAASDWVRGERVLTGAAPALDAALRQALRSDRSAA